MSGTEEKVSSGSGRALAVAELLRAGHSAQQVSRALKVTDAGGSVADAMAELQKPDEPGYLDRLRKETPAHDQH